MNILVTGGAGFIGSVVSERLLAKGHTVVVLDNLSKGHQAAVPQAAKFVQGNINDEKNVAALLKKHHIEAVMHFAAFIEAGESMKKPELYFENNTVATFTLLKTLLAHNIKQFVFSSTAAVYGNPQKIPITEDSPLKPTNAYGESKLLVEQILAWFHQIHGFSYASLRYFNASGATATRGEEHTNESHLIPLAIQAAIGNRPALSLFGTDYQTKDGTCVRDYIHVDDLATAHLLALDAIAASSAPRALIYNLGSETGFTNREVIAAVEKVVGKKVPVTETARRAGDPTTLIASSKKIRTELRWKPQYTDIQSIIESAWKWRKGHPHGYKK